MEIQYRKLSDIKLLEDNPRKISKDMMEKLKESIMKNRDYFEARPLILSDRTGELVVIAGNQRYKACQELGIEEVPTALLSGLTEEREREIVIRDNVNNGEWDESLLINWDSDKLEDWGVVPTWEEVEEDDNKAEEDNFTEEDSENVKTRVNYGDIFQLGDHRLMCGDSTKREEVGRLMKGEKADMVFTDPPYGMKKESEGIKNDNLNFDDLLEFNKKWIPITFENTKDNGSWYCWGMDEPLMDIYSDILKPMQRDNKITFRNIITWNKGTGQGQKSEGFRMYPIADEKCLFVMCGVATISNGKFRTKKYFFEGFSPIRDYLREELEKSGLKMKDIEKITSTYSSHYFSESQWAFPTEKDYNVIRNHCNGNAFKKEYDELKKEYAKQQKEYANTLPYFDNTHENMNNVWNYESNPFGETRKQFLEEMKECGGHATPKPLRLCARGIKTSSREGEIVLDVFGGSGSTLIACEQLNRKCRMMELSEHYCDVIIARWEKLTGNVAVKL